MKNEFIAYDKRKKCFIPSYRVAMNGEGEIYISQDQGEGYYLKVDSRIEILEYSGRTDRNGIKLYKGDIVKVELEEYVGGTPPLYEEYEEIPAKTIIGVVVIRPSEGSRILVKKIIPEGVAGITKGQTIRIKQDRDVRIGHVYTNPELIK